MSGWSVTPVEKGDVRGSLQRPDVEVGRGLVLTHGAGGDRNAPLLVAVADAFCEAGMTVLRCDLPFRQRRPSGPPSPSSAAADRTGLRNAVAALRETVSGQVYLGGHSYGGRQASMLAADEPDVVSGLLLLSYPLHPPARPEQLRTQHFPRLQAPSVFVHGSADPFGSIEELRSAIAAIPAPCRLIPIENARHDLKRGRFDLRSIIDALCGGAEEV
ncbi:MAG TPA: alpha/beta fold hydrolase [Alphaproteobacteria bacterium]|nr:alpha/beta fold hydrolase [Alphaproteobacteria bacterium]